MDSSELLKKVRKIEIKTKGLSANIFAGEYHSAFKGRGMSFSEVRAYQYGDDVRNIDWNVTARSNTPFIKVFEEERELTLMLLIDISGSMFFGTRSLWKSEMMTEICAVLAFSALNNNDKVGVIFFSDVIEKFIPPQKGRMHILRIIRELLDFKPKSSRTDISKGLQYLNNVIKKRSTCFLLSDFMGRGYEDALRICSKRHDLIGVHLVDPVEKELPALGLMPVHDPETGKWMMMDTSDGKTRKIYKNIYEENIRYFSTVFLKTGTDTMSISTDHSYIDALRQFFKQRHQ